MEMTRIEAIKTFFDVPGKPVSNRECMELSKEEREELGDAALKALGAILKITSVIK